ncbi:unspecified product [Leptomonas pyrrhocoris]|uniref:Small RNA 2'-O-methyltransferase n=1 Tax=Leptomonas pyrrhocoris TaxID=157538 RepID=A0A0M9FYD7_LEPPY|nr:unspecified product [Leptomonas pyrrhocoris]KPA78635.1 unspecified product [Leptomonas pyrrhocoris]|eukprot:XP_015657074.1 unspecified product [Leptomonas pyrrhocoris]
MAQCAADTANSALASDAKVEREEEDGLVFNPPLYSQRAQLVHRVLQRYSCRRIIDAGCSRGDLLQFLMHASSLSHVQLTAVTAIDIDGEALREVSKVLPFSSFTVASYTADCTVQCIQGDLTSCVTVPAEWLPYPLSLSSSFSCSSAPGAPATDSAAVHDATVDAVCSIEVIEHIPPHAVAAYTYTLFAELGAARGARVVLLTTPNRDENTRLPRHPLQQRRGSAQDCERSFTEATNSIYRPWESAPRRRHDEHFFELTRTQWKRYVAYVEECYGSYWKTQEDVLLGEGFTQGTLFVARASEHPRKAACISTVFPFLSQAGPVQLAKQRCSHVDRASHGVRCTARTPQEESLSAHTSHRGVRVSRDAAIAAFPFESIFGMPFADYASHFLRPNTPRPSLPQQALTFDAATGTPIGLASCGCDLPYTRVAHRVIEGVALWDRLRGVVRRCYAGLSSASSSPSHAAGQRKRAISFTEFYTAHVVPLLYVLLEECTVPLLWRSLAEQRGLWVRATQDDTAHWRRYVRQTRKEEYLLRACRLRVDAAHVPPRSRASSTSTATSLFLSSSCVGAASSGAAGIVVPLFPFPSEAYSVLSRALRHDSSWCNGGGAGGGGDARPMKCCVQGLQLLEKGTTDSVGLLLAEWLCAEVTRCLSNTTEQRRGGAPCRLLSSAPPAAAATEMPTRTLKCLPTRLLQLLFFLVSVDVIPDAYAALCSWWRSREQHLAALHRDVCAACDATTYSPRGDDAPRGQPRPRRRRRLAASSGEAPSPPWLVSLMDCSISFP